MTFDERVKEVAEFGLTERQAGFLVNVMLHSGVFVRRQDLRLGQADSREKVHQFIKRLDSRRMATSQRCADTVEGVCTTCTSSPLRRHR